MKQSKFEHYMKVQQTDIFLNYSFEKRAPILIFPKLEILKVIINA